VPPPGGPVPVRMLPCEGIAGRMEPVARERVAERIERLDAIDVVAEPLQRALRAGIPQGTRLKDLLSGTWLGHPLHPPLTDVVIGSWTGALVVDAIGGAGGEAPADALVATGILAAVPTALAGASDWAELLGGTRRVGAVHAVGNTTALLLHVASLAARRGGDRRRGIALSALGYAVATGSAWLGGHLSFGRGVGVNQTAFEDAPDEWTSILEESELRDGTLTHARAEGVDVAVLRLRGRLHALANRCSHRGCSLHEGRVEDDTIICPCHGSTFRLDGSIVTGPATAPQPTFQIRVDARTIQIKKADPTQS
jgi:nitrite reductase/ring-hydroxylating ferredoxin subunit/uncharacterized membrane protein